MIPTLIQPKNTVFCKKAYSNTIRQKWPPMSVSKLGVQQNSLLSELLGKGCLDPCRLSLASPHSHHRAQFGIFLFCCWLCRNSRCAVWHWLEQGGAQLTRCAELEAAAWAERRCWLALQTCSGPSFCTCSGAENSEHCLVTLCRCHSESPRILVVMATLKNFHIRSEGTHAGKYTECIRQWPFSCRLFRT